MRRLLAAAVCVLVFLAPDSSEAQSIERGFYAGAGAASSGTDRAAESGGGIVLLGGITTRNSERVFLDLEVMYGKLPRRGIDSLERPQTDVVGSPA